MREAIDFIDIQGILNEVDLKEKVDKNNKTFIAGKVHFLVDQDYCGDNEREEIAVDVFAYKETRDKKPHPGFESAMNLMENGVSVAACGDEKAASRYSIGGGSFTTNEFDTKDGRHIVYPVIRASFFNEVKTNFNPKATYITEIFIDKINDEIKEDIPTGRLIVSGVIVGYNNRVDKIDFIAEDKKAVSFIRNNWNTGDTVKISGIIRGTVSTETRVNDEEVGFGELPTRTFKKVVREYIITTGSHPYEDGDDDKYSASDIEAAFVSKNSSKPAVAEKIKSNRGF